MTLIKSISGIRGTIGGTAGDGLTPIDALKYTLAYAQMVLSNHQEPTVVIGRDARMSGAMISGIVCSGLSSMGVHVIDIGLSTTPTVEFAVKHLHAQGGIIITASHNPKHWNALKLLNHHGEFISEAEGKAIVNLAEQIDSIHYPDVDHLGTITQRHDLISAHIDSILKLDRVDRQAISARNPRIVVDAINSTGAVAVAELLSKLGITDVHILNSDMTGDFRHNPEPLPENLTEISEYVTAHGYDLGIVVDPDVDRLCMVSEDGTMFGEEYTLVAVADYILSHTPGNTVSNLSSTKALRDITLKRGGQYHASAVGEVNVVALMKSTQAVIGGEGNGGIIYPQNHYGRDALVGIALFLSYYAQEGIPMTELKARLPQYTMSKNKIELTSNINVDDILEQLHQKYRDTMTCTTIDGLKIDYENGWVHLRKSNTEPIIRIYSEAATQEAADLLAQNIIDQIHQLIA